mmetsp:Transcript_10879/g.36044  ORF Transcript_10879/g.36044 Transcript_10879/m.36044 type:complete len:81 (-) Transcript_10879:464-706(-)
MGRRIHGMPSPQKKLPIAARSCARRFASDVLAFFSSSVSGLCQIIAIELGSWVYKDFIAAGRPWCTDFAGEPLAAGSQHP